MSADRCKHCPVIEKVSERTLFVLCIAGDYLINSFLVVPVVLLSRDPGVCFALYFCTFVLLYFCTYGLRLLTSWRFAHTRPRGNQRLFPLGTPSRPATFSNSEKVAMGLALALTCICRPPRPYSKMLTLPMGRPFPSKASWPSMASSRYFLQRPQVKG